MTRLLDQDKVRYGSGSMPIFQRFYRKYQDASNPILKQVYRVLYRIFCKMNHIEIVSGTNIGGGLYIGHPYCITINPKAVIGKNCNIHKGVTIGQENRGKREGVPTIGDCVWIGINSTIVGRISVGNDVLIAPNTYVNCDVPPHSVVFGNPCIIKAKDNATDQYINNRIDNA